MNRLTTDTACTLLSIDRRRELEDLTLPAGVRVRKDERDGEGIGTFQASDDGKSWSNYRVR